MWIEMGEVGYRCTPYIHIWECAQTMWETYISTHGLAAYHPLSPHYTTCTTIPHYHYTILCYAILYNTIVLDVCWSSVHNTPPLILHISIIDYCPTSPSPILHLSCFTLAKAFVRQSAIMSLVPTCLGLITPASTFSLSQ